MERNDKSACSSRRTSRIDGWFHYSFLSFLLPVFFYFFISSTRVTWLTRPKFSRDASRNTMRGKNHEFDRDSKYAIYQKFLESRAFEGKARGEKKNIHAFLVRKFAFERNNFESLSTVGVYLRHGRHLSCLWIMYANLQAGITRRNWCRSRTYRFRINSKRIA